MEKMKKILAVSALSFTLLLPSAYSAAEKQSVTAASAAVAVSDYEIYESVPEVGVQFYENAEQTEKNEKKEFNPVKTFLISLAISLIIALIVVGSMKSQMKSVRRQSGAASYTKNNSFKLEINNDTYLYNEIEKTARPKSGN